MEVQVVLVVSSFPADTGRAHLGGICEERAFLVEDVGVLGAETRVERGNLVEGYVEHVVVEEHCLACEEGRGFQGAL